MKEHRLIERMIKIMENKLHEINENSLPDLEFIEKAYDFLRTYADRCHHGKEEDILFIRLDEKQLSEEHRDTMEKLIKEHVYARKTVGSLIEAKEKYEKGDKSALKDITGKMNDLVSLYPRHIETEDKHFFLPCMKYFSREELDEMLEEFAAFDRKIIHEKYTKLVEEYTK